MTVNYATKQDVQATIRHLTANLMRLARGSGNREAVIHQAKRFVAAYESCLEEGGRVVLLDDAISSAIQVRDDSDWSQKRGGLDELNDKDRWKARKLRKEQVIQEGVISWALRLSAARLDGNAIETSKADSGMVLGMLDWNKAHREEFDAKEAAEERKHEEKSKAEFEAYRTEETKFVEEVQQVASEVTERGRVPWQKVADIINARGHRDYCGKPFTYQLLYRRVHPRTGDR
jgi:hypothetical protein